MERIPIDLTRSPLIPAQAGIRTESADIPVYVNCVPAFAHRR